MIFFYPRLMNFFSSGALNRIKRSNLVYLYKTEMEKKFEPVEIDQMIEVLSIVPIGILIAFILIIFELTLKNKFFLRGFFLRNKRGQQNSISAEFLQ